MIAWPAHLEGSIEREGREYVVRLDGAFIGYAAIYGRAERLLAEARDHAMRTAR